MIGFLHGEVAGLSPDGCYLDVNGVGYRLSCSATTLGALPPVGQRVRLWAHTYVREDSLALFGFVSEGERAMFEALLGVAGVGPKVALQVCSAFSPEAFRRVLVSEDTDAISSVPGIGKKTAGRIVLDVKEKLQLPDLEVVGKGRDALAEARSALQNLGYSQSEVRAALAALSPDDGADVADVIKSALRVLAG
ncbi:MAG: Holliday junction branch migration protein RuvA [Actinomycetota bacterium]|nr:Holliday junction branch migration protein RuvA [Actinomycetota bacterium]